jgi:hypothetical protein
VPQRQQRRSAKWSRDHHDERPKQTNKQTETNQQTENQTGNAAAGRKGRPHLLALALDERRERVAARADLAAVRVARAHEERRRVLSGRAAEAVAGRDALRGAHLARDHLGRAGGSG